MKNTDKKSDAVLLKQQADELILANKALLKSEERLRRAQQIANMGTWDWDLVNDELYWAESYYTLLGIDPQKIKPSFHTFLHLVDPAEHEFINKTIDDALKNKKSLEIDYSVIRPDNGKKIIIHANADISYDSNGKPLRMIGTVQDVTDRKHNEDLLKESANNWQATFDGITDSVFLLDPNGIILQANKSSQSLFSSNENNILGQYCYKVVHKTDCYFDNCPFVRSKISNQRETMLLPVDDKWFTVTVDPILNKTNTLTGFVHIVSDVTSHKQSEESLRHSEERFRKVFEDGPLGIAMTYLTGSGRFINVNSAFCNMLGYAEEELKKLTFSDVTYPDDRDKDIQALRQLLDGQIQKHITEKRYLKKNGEMIWCNRYLTKICSEEGKAAYALSMIEDITERKNTEDILKKVNVKLTKSNAEKDKFFSVIAHDLKSPFFGFLGLTHDFAKNAGNISPKDLAYMGSTMYHSADNLFKLLQNLLEWAQLQSGLIKLEPKNVSLTNLINKNIETINDRCVHKGISIINNVSKPVQVYADKDMINSVLLNLLSNAVKFTNKNGSVTINALPSLNQMIQVSVSDTGIGIPLNLIDKLFHVGEKTGRKGTDGELSTGLGLLLSKEWR